MKCPFAVCAICMWLLMQIICQIESVHAAQADSRDSFFDDMDGYDTTLWQKSDGAWGGHYECAFRPDHVTHGNGLMTITLDDQPNYGFRYTSGEYVTTDLYGYGLVEGRIRFSCTEPGTVASLFTYTDHWDGNPISEIDIEILGNDPTVMWCSIVGPPNYWGDTVQLGFDASQDFHIYGFEWTPTTVSWIVDGQVVLTGDGSILPPNVPARILANFWNGDYGWTGEFNYPGTPLTTEYDWIKYTPRSSTELTCEAIGGELTLTWLPVPEALNYWVYGAVNAVYFSPGVVPPYNHRLGVLPQGITTWVSPYPIADPERNWSYLVTAVDETETELSRSNRVGEHDFEAGIP